ncbi:rhombosortase [Kaarinaea lacus]
MKASSPLSLRFYMIPISLAIIVTFIAGFGSELSVWLRYDRAALEHGQIWRVFSGHLVHLSWSHLFMNVAGMALIWAIFAHQYRWSEWLLIIIVGAIGVSLCLYWFNPELRWYVGLSGILHTLFIAGCLVELKQPRWDSRILFSLVIVKLAYEQIWGPMPGSEETAGGNVIVDAHLYGAIFGGIAYLILASVNKSRAENTTTN